MGEDKIKLEKFICDLVLSSAMNNEGVIKVNDVQKALKEQGLTIENGHIQPISKENIFDMVSKPIDPEIQKVINENWWDMLDDDWQPQDGDVVADKNTGRKFMIFKCEDGFTFDMVDIDRKNGIAGGTNITPFMIKEYYTLARREKKEEEPKEITVDEMKRHFEREFPSSSEYSAIYRIGVLDTINKIKEGYAIIDKRN